MSTPLTDALNAQGALQPGTEGYWKVWGASVRDVQPGDLLMTKRGDDYVEYEVEAYEPRTDDHESVADAFRLAASGKQLGDLRDMVRPRFLATSGETFTIGALQPILLYRRGTHHVLSDYVR